MNDLRGKVVVVMGGASGIGESCVNKLSDLGAKVMIADINEGVGIELKNRIKSKGGEVEFFKLDIFYEDQIKGLFDFTAMTYSRVDVLINSVGVPRTVAPDSEIKDMLVEDWNKTLWAHATSAMLACKYVLQHMIDAGGGAIVNISSAASRFATVDLAAYSASKAAVNQLSKEVAVTYGRNNIRCNVVVPGAVLTERGRKTLDNGAFELFATETPLPRIASPSDIANVAIFLASDMSAMVTGQAIDVDGGMMSKLPYWLPKMRSSRGDFFDKTTCQL
ncbi:dehydrogenase of unknown specificity, short-chain alcohol dehydrogenase like [Spongiibacter sp. IMCC21906]|nr:dehydrogenase of unknown specificity, short-chain alcohol dehydrogenase like [Spongiibacter sp. IMCC21906]